MYVTDKSYILYIYYVYNKYSHDLRTYSIRTFDLSLSLYPSFSLALYAYTYQANNKTEESLLLLNTRTYVRAQLCTLRATHMHAYTHTHKHTYSILIWKHFLFALTIFSFVYMSSFYVHCVRFFYKLGVAYRHHHHIAGTTAVVGVYRSGQPDATASMATNTATHRQIKTHTQTQPTNQPTN